MAIEMSDKVKEKILMFFLKTSVPRIIEEDRRKARQEEIRVCGNMSKLVE